jgi:hypothetical protein
MPTLPATFLRAFRTARAASLLISSLTGLTLAAAWMLFVQGPTPALAQPGAAPASLTYPGPGNCSTTLQHCINTAANGQTINILPGIYITSVTMNRAVSLVGAGVGTTILQALPGHRVLTVTVAMTSSTQIANMTVQGGNAGSDCGGGMYLTATAQPLLQNLLIYANSASSGAGLCSLSSISLISVTVRNNTATGFDGGGMVVFSSVVATNSVFQNNTVITGGYGGGLAVYTDFTGTNVSFLSNTVNTPYALGGGLVVYGRATLTGGLFQHNRLTGVSGGAGGGMYAGALVISGTQFVNNIANTGAGGGVETFNLSPNANDQFTNVTFIRNKAAAGGGLVTVYTATLTAVDFLTNTATGFGGGAYVGVFNFSTTLSGGTFLSNTASSGGGLYSAGAITATATRFLTNSAQFFGGAGEGLGSVWLDGATLMGNTTAGYGGALQTYGQTHILNSLIQGNQAAANGGALSAVGRVWITQSDFISNTAQGDGTFGGGAVTSNDAIIAANSRFVGNTANTSPGGALVAGLGLLLDHSEFTGNTAATGDGGAAIALGGATLDHVTFFGNHSGLNGGALAVIGTLAVSSTLVTGNSANTGGGLYLYAGGGRIVNSLFAGNSATSTAGMQLYLAPTGTLQLIHNTVGAPSLALGDAIRVAGGSVQIYDTLVTSHTTGVRRLAGALTQDYNLFFGNTTAILGGAAGGTHHASGDPRFVDPAAGNYHLLSGSPAINVATDLGVPVDIDGDPRPFGAGFDIGYDEFTPLKLFLPLLQR